MSDYGVFGLVAVTLILCLVMYLVSLAFMYEEKKKNLKKKFIEEKKVDK